MRHRSTAFAAFIVAGAFLLSPTSNVYAADADDDNVDEEVIVTGTYIRRQNQADVTSPLDTVGLEDIEANGWTDLEDITETFTFNTSSWGRGGLRSGCCGTARGIEIRGLGSSSTLVLQNGKRVASTSTGAGGADMTNIKALMPVIAIDRMETLLDGGAALYGSDAVAGVVNLIPRKDFEGFEVRTGGKQIDGAGQWEIQAIAGVGNDRVHGIFAVGYEHHDHLLNLERPFRLINNTSGNGSPGTYFAADRPMNGDGSDVVIDNGFHGPVNFSQLYDQALLGTGPFDPANGGPGAQPGLSFADPYCRSGIVADKGPVPGGGQFTPLYSGAPFPLGTCRFSYQPHNSIIPQENTLLMYTNWNVTLNDYQNLEFEYSGYRRESDTRFIATFPMTNGKPIVPGSSPYNQLGVDLTWTGRPMGLAYPPVHTEGEGDATRYAATLTGDVSQFIKADWAQTWTYTVSAQWSHAFETGDAPDTDLRLVQSALNGYGGSLCNVRFDGPAPSAVAGSGNCYYFSPFARDIYLSTFDSNSGYGVVGRTDSNGNLVRVTDQGEVWDVLNYSIQTESHSSGERSLRVLEGVITGDLFDLPGGPIGVAFGYQNRVHTREVFIDAFRQGFWQGFLSPSVGGKGGRTVDAYFAEAYLPFNEIFDVQAAVRMEDYGNIDSVDPKIGAKLRISDSLTARASWGTSFRAASLGQVVGNDTSSFVAEVRDPIHPAEQNTGTFRTILVSKNPNLAPEESTNYNVGFSWTPALPWGDDTHEFQIDLDYWNFEFENQIRGEDPNAVVAADPCGPQVRRDPINIIVGALLQNQGASGCPTPVGEVIVVETGFFNSGKTETSGIDLGMRYSFDWLGSTWIVRSETSYIDTYEVQTTSGGSVIDGAGFRNDGNPGSPTPDVRSNLFLTWMYDRHSANVTVRYIAGFEDDAFGLRTNNNSQGLFDDISSSTEVDVQYNYVFGDAENYTVSVGAINVGDRTPPYAFFEGYVSRVHNPMLRQVYARVSMTL